MVMAASTHETHFSFSDFIIKKKWIALKFTYIVNISLFIST